MSEIQSPERRGARLVWGAAAVLGSLVLSACSITPVLPDSMGPNASAHSVREKMASDAPINLIHIRTQFSDSPPPELQNYIPAGIILKSLQEDNGALVASMLRLDIARATQKRYTPSRIDVAQTPKHDFGACVDISSPKVINNIQEVASTHAKPDSINVIAVDALSCKPFLSDKVSSGVGYPDTYPIVTPQGYPDLSSNIIHEIGHVAGLGHSGLPNCTPQTQSEACFNADENKSYLSAETADRRSIMSYQPDKGGYTYPELNFLGLLKPDEVITNPQPGVTYQLTPDGKGAKLLTMKWGKDTVSIAFGMPNGLLGISKSVDITRGHPDAVGNTAHTLIATHPVKPSSSSGVTTTIGENSIYIAPDPTGAAVRIEHILAA